MFSRYTLLQVGCTVASHCITSVYFRLYAKGRSRIEIELMAREKEGENVDARGNPAVVCILCVTSVNLFVELAY